MTIPEPVTNGADRDRDTRTPQGHSHVHFLGCVLRVAGIWANQDGREERRFRPRIGLETGFPAESDTEAFMRDMITITPLLFDWTAYSVVDQLKGWALSHEVAR